MQNDSKVVVVSGGARGIGFNAAKLMVKDGLRMAILDINEELGVPAAEELSKDADSAFFKCNVMDVKQINETIDKVYERFGRIDALLNAAALTNHMHIPEITEEVWDRFLAIDLKAPFFMAQACAPYMKKSGGGRIINFSSMLSTLADGHHTLYTIAKEGLNGMTRELSVDLCRDNIQTVSILPAYIITPLVAFHLDEPGWGDRQLARCLNKRLLYPEDLAKVIKYLVTSKSNAIAGAKIHVDAGQMSYRYKVNEQANGYICAEASAPNTITRPNS